MILGMRQSPAASPVVQSNFALSANDFDSLSSTSTMPTGGSISRAGNAMLYDSTGKLTYAPNNLLTYSNTFSDGSWSKTAAGNGVIPTVTDNYSTAPNGTQTAARIQFSLGAGGSSGSRLFRGGISTASTLLGSIWLKTNDNSTKTLYFQSGGAPLAVTVTGTWTQFASTPGTTYGQMQFGLQDGAYNGITTSTTADILVWSAVTSAVTYETTPRSGDQVITTSSAYYGPRFDYDPVTLAAKGLLVEGTRTNVCLQSNAFTTTWTNGNGSPTVTSAAGVSPDGTNNAWKITTTNTASNQYNIQQQITLGSGSTVTLSAYVKYGNSQWVAIGFYDGAWFLGLFDTINGVSGNVSAGATIGTPINCGNGWWRISLTRTLSNANPFVGLFMRGSNSLTLNWTPSGTEFDYFYGAQLEAGSFATSYIPTVASSVARAAETFSLTGYANRLVEAYYIDEQTGGSYSGNSALSTGTVTISPPTFGWVTSLRAYTNVYAGSISSPSWLSFSRAGNAMYYDSTGTLTWAPANIFQRSQSLATAPWGADAGIGRAENSGTAPDGTNTANLLTETSGTSSQQRAYQAITVGALYVYSVYVKAGTQTFARVSLNDGNDAGVTVNLSTGVVTNTYASTGWTLVSYGSTSVGNGWYRVFVSAYKTGSTTYYPLIAPADSGSAGSNYTYTGASKTIYVWGAQLEPVTYQTAPSAYIPTTSAAVYGPRYDYDPSTVPATPRGLLIEESRANIALWSEQFDNAGWVKSALQPFGSGSITNAIASPDGTQSADYIVATTASATHAAYQTITVVAATTYTITFYAKQGGYTKVAVYDIVNGRAGAWFNLATGVFIGSGGAGYVSSSVTNSGNGWYRCSMTFTASPTSFGYALVGYPDSATPNAAGFAYAGDGVSGVYLWGAQLEAGSFATSYIPTTTASVTRAADVAQLTGSALTTLQGANASVLIQTNSLKGLITQQAILGDSASFSPIQTVAVSLPRTYTPVSAFNGNTFTGNYTTGSVRTGLAWSASGRSIVANAATVATGAGGTIFGSSTIYIGSTNAAGSYTNGYMQSFAAYNQKLPDSTLQQKSVVNAPY